MEDWKKESKSNFFKWLVILDKMSSLLFDDGIMDLNSKHFEAWCSRVTGGISQTFVFSKRFLNIEQWYFLGYLWCDGTNFEILRAVQF